MKILALDLSTNTGWAAGEIGGRPLHGVIRLPSTKKDIGLFAQFFETEVRVLLAVQKPDRVVFESPILTGTTRLATLRKLYGLAYHTELICLQRDIPCSETHMQTARSTLGFKQLPRSVKDKAARRKHTKSEIMRLCRAMGWEPADDNEADALCIWNDACLAFKPRQSILAL